MAITWVGRALWGVGKFVIRDLVLPIVVTAVVAAVLVKFADRVRPSAIDVTSRKDFERDLEDLAAAA